MDRVRSALLPAGALALAAGASLAFAQPVSIPTALRLAGVGPNEQGWPGGGQQQHCNLPPALEACKTSRLEQKL